MKHVHVSRFITAVSSWLAPRLSLMAVLPPERPQASQLADDVAAMQQFLGRQRTVHQYSAWRRLDATGGGQRGWMEVQTDFSPASGLQYRVIAEGGSGYIRGRVLRSLLDEEQKLIADNKTSTVAVATDNYQFTPDGVDNEGLAAVRVKPLRKDRSLIAGRILLSPEGNLLRMEGQLVKNPSFWVTRVHMVRAYQRINGVQVPVSLDTTGQLRLLGKSSLRMTYRYSQVDDRAVEDEN